MALFKRLFVNITRAVRRGLYCKQPFIYGHITCQQSLLRIYNTASIILEKKVSFIHGSIAAVYIKLYKRHDFPMKNDVTNVQYYKKLNKRHDYPMKGDVSNVQY
jgi:hypothetical protein